VPRVVEDLEATQISPSPIPVPCAGKAGESGPGVLYLITLQGGIPGAMLPLRIGTNTIGRGTSNMLTVAEKTVSRRHASILVDVGGQTWLTDLGSRNGTLVNGVPLVCHQAVSLRDGDRIGLGSESVFKLIRTDPVDERHYRQMFERAVRDPLTGLYNRFYFADQFDIRAHQGFARRLGFAVFMIDIDHFKAINDRHGHEFGDTVLRAVARMLQERAGPDNLVARYGGEEFVVAAPVESAQAAEQQANRLRAGFHTLSMPVAGSGEISLTASIGVAFTPAASAGSLGSLLRQADEAMYRAKRAGRDRIVLVVPER